MSDLYFSFLILEPLIEQPLLHFQLIGMIFLKESDSLLITVLLLLKFLFQ